MCKRTRPHCIPRQDRWDGQNACQDCGNEFGQIFQRNRSALARNHRSRHQNSGSSLAYFPIVLNSSVKMRSFHARNVVRNRSQIIIFRARLSTIGAVRTIVPIPTLSPSVPSALTFEFSSFYLFIGHTLSPNREARDFRNSSIFGPPLNISWSSISGTRRLCHYSLRTRAF